MVVSAPPEMDWRDEKRGGLVRAALWLVAEVGEGKTFTKAQLREAFPSLASIERRVRDLRDYEWRIETFHTHPNLEPNEFLFATAGVHVWDPMARAAHPRAAEFTLRSRAAERHAIASPGEVWTRLQALSDKERALVLGWMAMDRRPSSPAELAWRAYRSLPTPSRRDLMAKLGELVSAGSSDDPLTPDSGGNAVS
ncbi:hypothetical protein [Streptomyces sp. NPDC126933]|uniref:hypothetical protein n=1 Tax=unclassified Streptomyces TaxID=2593676 RepID=UPI003651AE47